MNEVNRVQKEAEWFALGGKWPYLPGDPVLVVEKKGVKIGRIDCVRLHYCPTQNQGKEPDSKTLWVRPENGISRSNYSLQPIYFFGESDKKKKRQWIPASNIKGRILCSKAKTCEQVREYIEKTIKDHGFKIDTQLNQAIESVINNPMEEHQFFLSAEDIKKNSNARDLYIETFTKWFCNDEDIKLKYDWVEEGEKLGLKLGTVQILLIFKK